VAEPALRQALDMKPPLDLKTRLERLLLRITDGTPDDIRAVRAIVALEYANTPPARKLLQQLAKGAEGALTTRTASAALRRLEKQEK
jgi:hypothetical protein